jgi:leukotriene-A4 hydrolase
MPDSAAWARWTTDERLRFLTRIDKQQQASRLATLDQAFNLSRSGNSEIRFAFLDLAVKNRFDPAIPALEEFLTVQGRRKFVRPLITELASDSQWGRPIAARIYAKTRASYHPITTRDLDKLGLLPRAENKNL